jgi:hypothetical protein
MVRIGSDEALSAYPGGRIHHDVVITPLSRVLDEDSGDGFHVGGPRWPDWETASDLRYLNHADAPLDRLEPLDPDDEARMETVPGLWWWIGPLTSHFGHFLAEFAVRIRPVLDRDPDARLVFARSHGGVFPAPGPTPAFVAEILDWHGVPAERVRIVDRPVRFERLGTCPQPERLYPGASSAPDEDYLSSLSQALQARLGPRRAQGTVYVSRTRATRLFAGEVELEAAMAAAGVTILRPEEMPLVRQVETIRNAETAVFAEGSALHLLQLGGRDFGRVVVLTRRPGHRMAEHLLRPRCEELVYLDTAERFVVGHKPGGSLRVSRALSVPSPERIEAALSPLGLDLRGRIDRARFRREAGRDLRAFAAGLGPSVYGRGRRSVRNMATEAMASGLPGRRRAAAWISWRWVITALGRRADRLSSGRNGRRAS